MGGRLLGKKKVAIWSEGGDKKGWERFMFRVYSTHVSNVTINSLFSDTLQNSEA